MNRSFYKLFAIAMISVFAMNTNAMQSVTEYQQEKPTSKTVVVSDRDEDGTFFTLVRHRGNEISLRRIKELSDQFYIIQAKAAEYLRSRGIFISQYSTNAKPLTYVLKGIKVGDFIKLVSEEFPEDPFFNKTLKVVE